MKVSNSLADLFTIHQVFRYHLTSKLNSKIVPVLPSLDLSPTFPFHILLSQVHPTGFFFCFFPGFLLNSWTQYRIHDYDLKKASSEMLLKTLRQMLLGNSLQNKIILYISICIQCLVLHFIRIYTKFDLHRTMGKCWKPGGKVMG